MLFSVAVNVKNKTGGKCLTFYDPKWSSLLISFMQIYAMTDNEMISIFKQCKTTAKQLTTPFLFIN